MRYLALSAGMPRSGSTWLFNAIRLIMSRMGGGASDLTSCWIDDLARAPTKPRELVKLHVFDAELARKADFVAYSYRDLRDALASQFRKFGTTPTLELADQFVDQHRRWMGRANHVMRYEHMLEDPGRELSRIANALGCDIAEPDALASELGGMSYGSDGTKNGTYNETTLFHQNHVTDGRIGSWHNGLSVSLERRIVERHASWFVENGYSTE